MDSPSVAQRGSGTARLGCTIILWAWDSAGALPGSAGRGRRPVPRGTTLPRGPPSRSARAFSTLCAGRSSTFHDVRRETMIVMRSRLHGEHIACSTAIAVSAPPRVIACLVSRQVETASHCRMPPILSGPRTLDRWPRSRSAATPTVSSPQGGPCCFLPDTKRSIGSLTPGCVLTPSEALSRSANGGNVSAFDLRRHHQSPVGLTRLAFCMRDCRRVPASLSYR